MNQRQRIAIAVGIVLVALSGLVPPYQGEMVREGDNLKAHMGYHFLFAPPSQRAVATVLRYDSLSDGYLNLFNARIATDRVLIQILTITVVTAGAVALLADRKET